MLAHAHEDVVLWRHLAMKRACDALGDELRGRLVVENEDDELRALKAGKRALRISHLRIAFRIGQEDLGVIRHDVFILMDMCPDRLNIKLGKVTR